MESDRGTFEGGMLCGAAIAAVVFFLLAFFGSPQEWIQKKTACEREIPRKQQCVMVAVPDNGEGK